MSGPTRATAAGRTYLDLRKKARADGRRTEELLQLYALEAFVDRLAGSDLEPDFVLKGGVLLSAYDIRRPTKDVDLAARRTSNDPEHVRRLIATVLEEKRDDGLVYERASAEVIRDGDAYSGVRVTVPCSLDTARITFHVDVNVGDVVWPEARPVTVPRLLGGTIAVRGYPLSMIFAEKIVTAVQRGIANTRWRDYADMYLLSGKHRVDGDEVRESVRRVADYRSAPRSALSVVLAGYSDIAQNKWAAWLQKQALTERLPLTFDEVLVEVQQFADPLMEDAEPLGQWDPESRTWATRSAE
jgi:hypothetical protein